MAGGHGLTLRVVLRAVEDTLAEKEAATPPDLAQIEQLRRLRSSLIGELQADLDRCGRRD